MIPGPLNEKLKRIRLLGLDVDGVFTTGHFWLGPNGEEYKCFSTQDGLGVKRLQKAGIPVALISGRGGHVMERYAKQLGIEHCYAYCKDKAAAFDTLLAHYGLSKPEVAYAGDDLPDLPLLKRAGLAIAVKNAIDKVKTVADFTTQAAGGHGAVREIAEMILTAQGKADD